ncbi:hypothetical protein M0805_003304 [Coniferiporia weirii]|nr:hypothetical protein M0805_003304 [Coniferiporia weirii]
MADERELELAADRGKEDRRYGSDTDFEQELTYDPAHAQKIGLGRITHTLLTWGVETRGIYPVPRERRTDQHFHKIFFIWFAANFNILSVSTGTTGPMVYGLSLRDSCLLILFMNILCCAPPAYLSTWGPKLGLRQMCQARYSFGWRIFTYSFLGFLIPTVSCQCLGAAIGAATPLVPAWNAAYADESIGNLFVAILGPVHGFGKFLTVLLSLSVTANIAPTMYSFGFVFQVFVPFCAHLPRYVFSVLATAVVIPLSIVGAHRFYSTLTNFLGLIGYWASCFISVVVVEHLVFRRYARWIVPRRTTEKGGPTKEYSLDAFANYDISTWNTPRALPSGAAALGASVLSFALVIPSMDQVWFVGPVARTTGDIGFEIALALTAVLYVPFRYAEVRWRGRL